jgi:hypothetical protein
MARVQVGFEDPSLAELRQQANRDAEPRGQGGHRVAAGRRLERAGNLGDHRAGLLLQLQRSTRSSLGFASGPDSRGSHIRGGTEYLRAA